MTKENKELLIKDLCARLPYGLFVKSLDGARVIYTLDYHPWIDNCKPYLRPLSSMTETEKIEFNEIKRYNVFYSTKGYYTEIDWLNAHGFDYRGLIEKGLAIEAPEGMYNSKNN